MEIASETNAIEVGAGFPTEVRPLDEEYPLSVDSTDDWSSSKRFDVRSEVSVSRGNYIVSLVVLAPGET